MSINMLFSDVESLHFSCFGRTHPLKLLCFCFLIEAKPVDQIGTNACWQVANSWSNCMRSKVVLGIFKISFPA